MPLTPKAIVAELDKHIVGQKEAKKAVAIAFRNRWRRQQIPAHLRQEITPKNILMIGPTGVGKTEIARRIAKIANAPFIKVEATKFTEVGYVGRDVDTIIRDLLDAGIKLERENATQALKLRAKTQAEEKILDILLPPPIGSDDNRVESSETSDQKSTRNTFRKRLQSGLLDDLEIEIELQPRINQPTSLGFFGASNLEDVNDQIHQILNSLSSIGNNGKNKRKLKIKEALHLLQIEQAESLINEEEVKSRAIENVEQNGIVFLDEIDKITGQREGSTGEVSRQGVQRDLLPLVEGTVVTTKHGAVRTDHILFIASGAFHLSKPSDLIPELQGRFPIRVELNPLSVADFFAILNQTEFNLIDQYRALLAADGLELEFTQEAVQRLAEMAYDLNEKIENIGARRLYTVLEKLLENLAFLAGDEIVGKQRIDAEFVNTQLGEISQNIDLSRYIL